MFDMFTMLFGKITVETPNHQTLKSTDDYEIRVYPPSVAAQVTYDPANVQDPDGYGFRILAEYIGAFGKPSNAKDAAPEPIAMTAPVITKEVGSPESIPMTAPVVTKEGGGKVMTMQFLLPAKYRSAAEAPRPLDERVELKEEAERKYGAVKFSGSVKSLKDKVAEEKCEKLKRCLERDGYKIVGEPVLGRYNPPWTLPFLRTNEIMIPVE